MGVKKITVSDLESLPLSDVKKFVDSKSDEIQESNFKEMISDTQKLIDLVTRMDNEFDTYYDKHYEIINMSGIKFRTYFINELKGNLLRLLNKLD